VQRALSDAGHREHTRGVHRVHAQREPADGFRRSRRPLRSPLRIGTSAQVYAPLEPVVSDRSWESLRHRRRNGAASDQKLPPGTGRHDVVDDSRVGADRAPPAQRAIASYSVVGARRNRNPYARRPSGRWATRPRDEPNPTLGTWSMNTACIGCLPNLGARRSLSPSHQLARGDRSQCVILPPNHRIEVIMDDGARTQPTQWLRKRAAHADCGTGQPTGGFSGRCCPGARLRLWWHVVRGAYAPGTRSG
jgi:hypothetical protein